MCNTEATITANTAMMRCLSGYSSTTKVYTLLWCVAVLTSQLLGCPQECTKCGDDTQCTLDSEWIGIPNDLSESASFLTISCQLGGSLGSLEGLDMYTSLRELVVTNCKLSQIAPRHLSALTRLTKLDLSKNSLTGLPAGLFQTQTDLQQLILSNNQIENIPSLVFQSLGKLTTLDMSNNKISTMSANSMVGLNSILKIDLTENKISDISDDVFRSKSLTELTLSNNELTVIKSDYFPMLDVLETLTLIGNSIESITVSALSLKTLKNIYMGGNKIRQLRTSMFHSNLEYINLENNQIQSISEGFFDYFPNMAACILSGNPFHCDCEMQWFKGYLTRREGLFRQKEWHKLPECATPLKNSFSGYADDQFVCVKPVISEIKSNKSETVVCSASGRPPPRLTWILSASQEVVASKAPPADRTLPENSMGFPLDKAKVSGNYLCTAVNSAGNDTVSVYVHITPKDTGSGVTGDRLVAVIAGGALGGLLILAAILIPIIFCLYRRNSRNKKNNNNHRNTGFDTVLPPSRRPSQSSKQISSKLNGSVHRSHSTSPQEFTPWNGDAKDHSRPSSRPSTGNGMGHVNKSFISNESRTPRTVRALPPTPDGRGGEVAKVMTPGFGALQRSDMADNDYAELDMYRNDDRAVSVAEYSDLPGHNMMVQKGVLNFEEEV